MCLFLSRARPLDQNRSVKWQDAARHKTSQSCVAGEFFMPLVVTKLAGHIVNGDHLLLGIEKSPLRLAHDRMSQESKGGSNFFWNTLRLQQLLLKSGQSSSIDAALSPQRLRRTRGSSRSSSGRLTSGMRRSTTRNAHAIPCTFAGWSVAWRMSIRHLQSKCSLGSARTRRSSTRLALALTHSRCCTSVAFTTRTLTTSRSCPTSLRMWMARARDLLSLTSVECLSALPSWMEC